MTRVTKQLRTETGHRLVNYSGRCAHLHGHSYLWEVTVRTIKLDDRRMVIDFKDLKSAMNTILDPLDHALLLAPEDPLWGIAKGYTDAVAEEAGGLVLTQEEALSAFVTATNGEEPRLFKWHENPTAESMAEWALHQIQTELRRLWRDNRDDPTTMPYHVSCVRVWETATSFAEARSGG